MKTVNAGYLSQDGVIQKLGPQINSDINGTALCFIIKETDTLVSPADSFLRS